MMRALIRWSSARRATSCTSLCTGYPECSLGLASPVRHDSLYARMTSLHNRAASKPAVRGGENVRLLGPGLLRPRRRKSKKIQLKR